MEKLKYFEPEMELIEFENEDVIITSNTSSGSSGNIETPMDPF